MATVGSTLHAERVRQGLAVEDIARITKLSSRAVQAIEADDFEQLPGFVFARNFVRQFAEALQLDASQISRQFEREQPGSDGDRAVPAARAPSTGRASSINRVPSFVPKVDRPASRSQVTSDAASAFTTFVLTLAVCGAAFWGFQYWRAHRQISTPARQVASQAARQPRAPKPVAAITASAPPTGGTAEPPPAADVAAASSGLPVALNQNPADPNAHAAVHVEIAAKAQCWARITSDGKLLFAGTLSPGDTRTVDAASVVTIRAGNAGALNLKLNGTAVPAIGPAGEVRSVSLTPAGAQVRTPSPELVSDF